MLAIQIHSGESGITAGIKMQHPVYFRGVTESSDLELQGGKLLDILYLESQYLTVRKMIQQGLDFRIINCGWQKVQYDILL